MPNPKGPGTTDVEASTEPPGSSGLQRTGASGGPGESGSKEGTHTRGDCPNRAEEHPSPEPEALEGRERKRASVIF